MSKVTPAGAVSVFASGFDDAVALAFDSFGNLYVADTQAGTVSKVTPAGAVTNFASGFTVPGGLAFDAAGNLYVANAGSSPAGGGIGHTVSEVTPAGTVTTFASGLVEPFGLAFDAVGNLYVANGDGVVSQVTPAGAISTFASGFQGPGLAFDHAGNLYISNAAAGTISRVTGSVGNFSIPVRLSAASSADTTIPFSSGGTAAAGTDFSGVSSSPLIIPAGQTTGFITGTLIPDLGPEKTLTFTLGTPTGADLGTPATNTLTIVEAPPNVAFKATSHGYLKLTAPLGTDLKNVTLTSNLPPNPPAGVSFPLGLLGFVLDGVAHGAQANVTLTLPSGVSMNTYFKYGLLPTNSTDTWYDFTADAQFVPGSSGGTGPESVVLTLTDGAAGDDDVNANGVIVDPGALGVILPTLQSQARLRPLLAKQPAYGFNERPILKRSIRWFHVYDQLERWHSPGDNRRHARQWRRRASESRLPKRGLAQGHRHRHRQPRGGRAGRDLRRLRCLRAAASAAGDRDWRPLANLKLAAKKRRKSWR